MQAHWQATPGTATQVGHSDAQPPLTHPTPGVAVTIEATVLSSLTAHARDALGLSTLANATLCVHASSDLAAWDTLLAPSLAQQAVPPVDAAAGTRAAASVPGAPTLCQPCVGSPAPGLVAMWSSLPRSSWEAE